MKACVAILAALLVFNTSVFAYGSRFGDPKGVSRLHSGYTKKDGKYVGPHWQTSPNNSKFDNWSSKPNVNPFTGKAGMKDPAGTGH